MCAIASHNADRVSGFKKIFINFSHLAFGEFASKAFGFLTSVYLARTLTVDQFGQYSWVMAVFAYLFLLGNFGFETYGVRTIANRSLKEVMNGILILRSAYVLILLTAVAAANFLFFHKANYLLVLQSASLTILPFNTQYIFRGLNKSRYDGFFRVSQAGLFFILVYWYVNSQRLLMIPVLWFIAAGCSSLIFWGIMTRTTPYKFSFPSFTIIKTVARDSLPIGIAGAIILFYMNFDTVLLGLYTNSQSVGIYSAAFRIYFFGYALVGLFYIAFLPSLSNENDRHSSVVHHHYVMSLLAASFVVAVLGVLISQPIIEMMFGHLYSEAIPVLKILFLSLAAGCINAAYLNPLQAVGNDTLFIKLLLLRTGVFIVLCFTLIPIYGIAGAAFSTLIVEVVTVPFSVYCYNFRP